MRFSLINGMPVRSFVKLWSLDLSSVSKKSSGRSELYSNHSF